MLARMCLAEIEFSNSGDISRRVFVVDGVMQTWAILSPVHTVLRCNFLQVEHHIRTNAFSVSDIALLRLARAAKSICSGVSFDQRTYADVANTTNLCQHEHGRITMLKKMLLIWFVSCDFECTDLEFVVFNTSSSTRVRVLSICNICGRAPCLVHGVLPSSTSCGFTTSSFCSPCRKLVASLSASHLVVFKRSD